jgi:hypothetical protein
MDRVTKPVVLILQMVEVKSSAPRSTLEQFHHGWSPERWPSYLAPELRLGQ